MLGEHRIHPVLLAKDLDAVREFYHDKLGLDLLDDNEDALRLRCGVGTELVVSKGTTGTSDTQTQAGWGVPDLAAEVADIRARGVQIEEYDMPGLKTQDGVADLGSARMAWIVDPGGNALSIMQVKA